MSEKLTKYEIKILDEYITHFEKMKKDVETTNDVLKELKWLDKHGFAKETKKGYYGKTVKGKKLFKLLKSLGIFKELK